MNIVETGLYSTRVPMKTEFLSKFHLFRQSGLFRPLSQWFLDNLTARDISLLEMGAPAPWPDGRTLHQLTRYTSPFWRSATPLPMMVHICSPPDNAPSKLSSRFTLIDKSTWNRGFTVRIFKYSCIKVIIQFRNSRIIST